MSMSDQAAHPAKIEANRSNAQKSTGPKDTSLTRLNAVKHGLLSNEVLMKDEDGGALAGLGERMRQELAPDGELENILVDRIVSSVWRLKRALRVERQYLEQTPSEGKGNLLGHLKRDITEVYGSLVRTELGNITAWMNLTRYETTIEKQIYKALHELQRIKSEKRGERPPLPISVDIDVSKEA
jgi:hypothetical protein